MSRIYFNDATIDFDIALPGEDFEPEAGDRKVNRDGDGGAEIILGWVDWNLTLPMLISEDEYNKFMGWFSWALNGQSFAIAVESTDTYNVTITGASGASEVDPKLITVSNTTGLANGDRLLLRSADRFTFEDVKVASFVASTSITTEWDMLQDYAIGATLRHYRYWPSLFVDDMKSFRASRQEVYDVDARGYRRFTLKCKEKF
jgi:hypothetical protein